MRKITLLCCSLLTLAAYSQKLDCQNIEERFLGMGAV